MLTIGKKVLRRIAVAGVGVLALLKFNATVAMFVSMFVSVLVYALPFGIWYAAGFVALLLAHELGHVVASRVVGVGARPPLFIPFLGAVVSLDRRPASAKMAANIAIGGPAMGALSALVCIALYFWTESTLLLVLAYTACILNLFNLIPSDPLDGAKVAAAISPHLWWAGSLIIGAMFFYTYNIVIFAILLFSLRRLWHADEEAAAYYALRPAQRLAVFSWYVGLVAVLGAATLYVGELLQ